MRLPDFIRAHSEQVLEEWERFARSISPNPQMTATDLRDNAKNMLEAIADDMESMQTERERVEKSRGEQDSLEHDEVDFASEVHARERARSGFELVAMVSEYRALRASVIRLWFEQAPPDNPETREDIRRFHEAVDQSMAIAIQRYAKLVDRSRQVFLAMLGHDLRSPLSAIAMNARLLTASDRGDPEIGDIGEGIASSARAMDGIIQDLLAFAGGQLGAPMPLIKEETDLGALVREVAREAESGSSNTIRVEDRTADLVGWWDEGRLRQLLSNLLSNAVQHGDGAVAITLDADDGDALLIVRNGGDPIPPDLLPVIFNPLIRPDAPDQRREGSLGLGLYIAREVVKAHGGTIDVESSRQTGTAFTVRLPRRAGGTPGDGIAGVGAEVSAAKNRG